MSKAKFISVGFCMVFLVFFAFACCPSVDKEMADAEAALQAARDAGAEGTPEYQAAAELIAKARAGAATGLTMGTAARPSTGAATGLAMDAPTRPASPLDTVADSRVILC